MADLAAARREAVRALDRWDSLPVTHRYDYEAAEVIRALRSLLAATEPAPALPEEVREASERLREQFAGHGPLTPFGQAAWDLLAALAAAKGGSSEP